MTDNAEMLLDLVEKLPHEERCTIVYGPLCDCARGLAVEKIGEIIEQGESDE